MERRSVEAASLQIDGDDYVCDGVENKLNILRVGGACQVTVDLLCRRLVLGNELSLNVFGGRVELIGTRILWKTNGQVASLDLLQEEVLLVEEENDRCVDEPLVVANGVEQAQALVHSIR